MASASNFVTPSRAMPRSSVLSVRQASPPMSVLDSSKLPTRNRVAKGDITDMLEIMGTAPGLKALRALESATEPVDISAAQATAARDAAAALIGNLPGYCVDHGRICTWSDDTPKPLCTFTAIANGVVTRDNGVDEETCREALRLASHKLPCRCKIVSRKQQEESAQDEK